MFAGFKKFIIRGNVVDLAVGIVVGAAFNSLIQTFVKGVFTPVLGIVGGVPDFSNFTFKIGHANFLIGDFLNSLISFFIVAVAIYFFVVVPINKIKDLANSGKSQDPTEKLCPFCYSEIPAKATRCPHCTSEIKDVKKK